MQPDPTVCMTAQGLCGLFRIVNVAHHHRRAGDADLALDIGLNLFLGAGGDDLIVSIRERHADGAGAGIVLRRQTRGGNALCGAVSLADLDFGIVCLKEVVHLALELNGQ